MPHKIIFFGTPRIASDTLEYLLKNNINIVAVVTSIDKKKGRSQKIQASPVSKVANAYSLNTIKCNSVNEPKIIEKLIEINADLYLVIAYGKILSSKVLSIPKYGCYNVHYSLLPKWRGPSPVQTTLLHGETTTGVTIIKMTNKVDNGPILAQEKINISNNINADQLFSELTMIGSKLLVENINVINKLKLFAQDETKASYSKFILKNDGFVDWNLASKKIYNQWQAYTSVPGIYTKLNGLKLILNQISLESDITDLKTGQAKVIDGCLFIGCRNSAIKVIQCQLEGRNQTDSSSFIRGLNKNLLDKLLNNLLPN